VASALHKLRHNVAIVAFLSPREPERQQAATHKVQQSGHKRLDEKDAVEIPIWRPPPCATHQQQRAADLVQRLSLVSLDRRRQIPQRAEGRQGYALPETTFFAGEEDERKRMRGYE